VSLPEEIPENPAPRPEPAVQVWRRATPQAHAERGSTYANAHEEAGFVLLDSPLVGSEVHLTVALDPAWDGWDMLRLTVLTLVSLIVGVFAALLIARVWIYPHQGLGQIARVPLVMVAGQCLAYLLILGYMYVLVTRERGCRDFLAAIHWNWPAQTVIYVLAGFVLAVGLQLLAHLLPMPKELPIDTFFRTPAEAWVLGIISVTLFPLMEELFFRGFLYPVLARGIGVPIAVFLTAFGFALLHVAQLGFAWGPVLVIFLVGTVLTMVRAKTNSVAAGLIIHVAYNGTLTAAMFALTDGFRHLEKLSSQ
jgi:hypothetical protein